MGYKQKIVTCIAAIAAGVLLLLCIVPQTRYVVPGLFIKKTVTVKVVDNQGIAVSNATVTLGSNQQKTDAYGNVVLSHIAVGNHVVHVSAVLYQDSMQTHRVALFRQPQDIKVTIVPVGEITKVSVKNRISGRAVVGARIVASQGGSGTTNNEGIALLSMPKGVQQASVTVSGETINSLVATVAASQSASDNILFATPVGRVAFLQKNGARLQVISSNLDGTDVAVLLDGTGNEDMSDTQLIGSGSTKFVALKARRDTAAGLYMLDIISRKLATIENEGQSYIPVGWRGDNFVYMVYSKRPVWQPGAYTLKAYNALNQQTTIIDQSRAEGGSVLDYASEVFENIYTMPEGIVYAKKWQASYYYGSRLANKQMTVTLADELGSKQDISQWQAGYNASIKTRQTGPKQLSVFIELDGVNRSYYIYQDKSVIDTARVNEDAFKQARQDTYFVSPNSLLSVWHTVEGKNYVGTVDATVATYLQLPSTYKTIGWFTNDYVLVVDTANNDLKIIARDIAQKGGTTTKIGTAYVAAIPYTAYGYGR